MRKLGRNKFRIEIDEDRQVLILQHTLGKALNVDISWRGQPRPWIIPSGLEVTIKPSYWNEKMQVIQYIQCPGCKVTAPWDAEGGSLIHKNASINGCESIQLELVQFIHPYSGER